MENATRLEQARYPAFALTNEIFERSSHAREELDCTDEIEIADYYGVREILGRITWWTCSDWSRTNGSALLPRDFPYLSSAWCRRETWTKEFGITVNKSKLETRVEFYHRDESFFCAILKIILVAE